MPLRGCSDNQHDEEEIPANQLTKLNVVMNEHASSLIEKKMTHYPTLYLPPLIVSSESPVVGTALGVAKSSSDGKADGEGAVETVVSVEGGGA